jgi:hypothetical protein
MINDPIPLFDVFSESSNLTMGAHLRFRGQCLRIVELGI